MYKLDLPVDIKETAAIERRKQKELERQSRIFNAKVRTIGVDIQALEQQSIERACISQEQKRREEAFAADMVKNDRICMLLQNRQANDVRELNKSLNEYRKLYQMPDSRKEWDLNNPDFKMIDKPARVSDYDPRCGISSMQKFHGEDLDGKDRKKLQQEQTREWCRQQLGEKWQEEANSQHAKRLHDLKMIEDDLRSAELARAEQECRKAINIATKDFNLALANENAANKASERLKEDMDNKTEIANNVYADMLTENPSVAQSAYGSHRVITDRWKGMSPAEVNTIRCIQHEQILEKKKLEEEEKQQNEQWNMKRIAQAKAATIMERQQEKFRRDLAKKQSDENLRLAAEKRKTDEYFKKEVYTNQPTAAFFNQFNRTSR